MAKLFAPCKGCEQREIGCHSSCGRYREYRQAMDEYNEQKYQQKEARFHMTGRILRSIKRKERWK